MKKIIVLMTLFVLLTTGSVFAKGVGEGPYSTPPGKRGKAIADRIGVSHDFVMSLWEQGYSFGAILHVGIISLATGIPILDIIQMTEKSTAWGILAPYFGTYTLYGYTTVGEFLRSPMYAPPPGRDAVPITGP